MFTKVLIIHHCDVDGRLSAELCARYEQKKPGNNSTTIDLLEVDYKSPLEDLINSHVEENYDFPDADISYYDRIYLLDYSISSSHIDNVRYITRLADNGVDITWIDHHISSIDTINNSDENTSKLLRNIKGLRVINASGSMLSFLYFNNKLGNIDPIDIGKIEKISNSYINIERFVIEKLWDKYKTPEMKVLMYVDAWDIWDRNTRLGWDNVKYSNSVLKTYSVSDLSKLIDSDQEMSNIIDIGKSVYKVNAKRDELLCESFGFEFPIVVNEVTGEKVYKAFALNYPVANSDVFGDRMEKYDICMPFYFNGTNYTYSMYSTKSDIDCSTLCRYYNGGGHPKAAGFVRDELIIEPGKTLYIDLYIIK